MSKLTAVIKNFSGGWNCDIDPSMLKPNELAVADNIDLLPGGGFTTRPGKTALNAISYGNGREGKVVVNWLRPWVRKDGTTVLLGVISHTSSSVSSDILYQIGVAGGGLTHIAAVATADISVEFYRDYILFLDGQNYQYSNGAYAYAMIPLALTGKKVPTITAQAGGASGAGVYKCMMTYVNSLGAESPSGDAVTVAASGGAKFFWSNLILSNDTSLVARKLYRTKVNGGVYYYVATIEDNTTAAYTDNVADVDLTVKFDFDTDIAAIAKCKYLARHPRSGRFFAAGNNEHPDRLYWSEIDSPGHWGASDYYEPQSGAGPIIGLDLFADGLLVMYQSCFYVWRGIDPGSLTDAATSNGDVTWTKLPVDHGVCHRRAACGTPGTYSFLSLGGIWTLNAAVYSDLNVAIIETENMVRNITKNKVLTEINRITDFRFCRLFWDVPRQRLLLAYTTDAGAVECADKILVYHWGNGGGFTRYTGLKVYDFCLLDNGDLYISGGDTIYKLNTGTSDAGAAIEAKVESAFFDFDAPMVRKKLYKVLLNAASGSSGNSRIELQVTNGVKVVGLKSITFVNQGADWTGAYTWAETTNWGLADSRNLSKERVVQGILEGQSFQLKIIHSNLGEQTRFFAVGMEYKKYTVKGERS